MSTDEFLAEILMVICFVPIAIYLLFLACDWIKHQWFLPRYNKDRIFRRIERESPGYRDNYRILR